MTLEDFCKYVLPDVPGCPTFTAKQAVLAAATEFLTFSGAWNEIQDPVDVQDNVSEYDLDAPSGARAIDIKAIYTTSGELVPVTLRELAQILPTWQTAEGSAPAYYTRAFDFTTIRVYPKPVNPPAETLTMHVVYTLKDTATTIPDAIVQRYQEPIASGAKARLMVMAKVAWSDPKLALYHKAMFDDGKLAARVTASHDKTPAGLYVPARAFGQ
jgi:hypothetical protein